MLIQILIAAAAVATVLGTGSANAGELNAAPSAVRAVQLPGTGWKIALDMPEFHLGQRRPIQPLASAILDWLEMNSDLPATHEPPHFKFASPATIAALRYRGAPAAYNVGMIDVHLSQPALHNLFALYDELSKTIFLPESWTGSTPAELSIVVREMVRYVQHSERVDYECPQSRDQIVYAAQEKWLGLFGRSLQSEFEMTPDLLKQSIECTNQP
jgi:hypothetical protein